MRLNAKVTWTLAILIVGSIALNYVVFRLFLYQSFTTLEDELAFRNVQRCRSAIQREIEYLATVVRDWAQWDDAYRYMGERSAEFESANLDIASFTDNRLSLVQYYDVSNRLVWSRILDLCASNDITLAGFSEGAPPCARILLNPAAPANSSSGVLLTDRGLLLVASSRILTTDAQGPARGVLVMGRFLDETEVQTLRDRVEVDLRVLPVHGGTVPQNASGRLDQLPPIGTPVIAPRDRYWLFASAVFEGLDGRPAFLMQIMVPREIAAKGREATYFASLSIAVVGLVLLATMLRLLQIVILRPLGALTLNVLAVRKDARLSRPIALPRRDEIGTLSREFEVTMTQWARAREQAEAANRVKTEFLSTVSHELRTPLNGIIGVSELIAASDTREANRAHARRIVTEVEYLTEMINELLDSAKIEAGRLGLETVPFDVLALMEEVSSLLGLHSVQKGLLFETAVEPQIPRMLMGDPYRIRQVLMNLASNAIKFTKEGSVKVSVRKVEEREDAVLLRFAVQDTGIGIPPEQQAKLFQRYVQADDETARKYGGTGLGMAISRDIVSLMGGDIGVESEVGKGSTFWFRVWLRTSAAPAPSRNPDARPGRILLVEDYETSREAALAHLRSAGHEVVTAATGADALARAGEGRFDIILMDVHLPDMTGIDVVRSLRKQATLAEVPIIAMTADTSQHARHECREAGMNDVVIKPLRRDILLAKVAEWIRSHSAAPALDWPRAVHEFGGDAEQVRQLAASFVENVRAQLDKMKSALDAGSLDVVRFEAHAIRGGAGNLAADDMAVAAARVEDAAAGGHAEEAGKGLAVLVAELARLESEVGKLVSDAAEQGGRA
ncbi:MAG: hypothetical protein BWK77_06310 [Verrucomicrobia bacterium A1]|nr:MAG: hypothetical protein BWK77_06310 [Verrucomicrobia bacterium A1]